MIFIWLFLAAVSNFLMFYPFTGINIYLRFLNPFFINLTYIFAGYIFYRFYKNKKELKEEIKMVRSELSEALKEALEYTNVLEKSNKRISELENIAVDDQEQINEILSELSIYANQLESIVNTIDAGICTIDRSGIIQADFNRGFREIFGDKEYWESSIFDTVFYSLSSKLKEELKEFINIAFSNTSTSNEMLNGANPVSEFVYIYNQEGSVENRYISTKVSRIFNDQKNVEKLMFVFNDITLQKSLEEDLKNREKKYQDELNLLTNIFQHDKELIVPFINDLNERIDIVRKTISEIEINSSSPDTLKEVQRMVHSIKGEAFTLGFEPLAQSCQEMETFIKENYNSVIDTEKNLILIEHIENIESWRNKLNEVAQKIFSYAKDEDKLEIDKITVVHDVYEEFIRGFKNLIELHSKNELTESKLKDYYEKIERLNWVDMQRFKKELALIAEKSAVYYKKDVDLNFIYDIQGIPLQKYKVLKEVLLHLIRNSIAHGIEDTEIRLKRNKDKTGKINIHIFDENGNYIVRYSDDGAGFSTEAIKKKAIEKGIIEGEKVVSLKNNEIIELIFRDGFSLKDGIDPVSGTGVGMSVVKNNIVYLLHGSISITNRPLKGVSFLIKFPK